ncbi:MAG: cobalamin B12-binding domain-containing protein [Ferruginibacter sp.]|nr:cobalamin B12-binding domain-containing protein [Cytophagales bacterium]
MEAPRLLFITPPLTQINTPYPATAYLKGFLGGRGFDVHQADLGIELVLKLFSREGLQRVFAAVRSSVFVREEGVRRLLRLEKDYLRTIGSTIRFLQGTDSTLANAIAYGSYLPEGARFDALEEMDWAFGSLGITDRARFLATRYLEDLSDLVRHTVCPHFELGRYAERLAMSATSFAPLEEALNQPANLVDQMLEEVTEQKIRQFQPDVVGFTVPFPGNVYGALRCARYLKQHHPRVRTVMGGGYPNTELRDLREPALFRYVDFVILDDGESPLLRLLEYLRGQRPADTLHRTFALENGEVTYHNGFRDRDIAQTEVGAPDYSDLPLPQYLSVMEVANPMHRLWSDGRWNKLTVAHGCYWMKCSFCDVTLDYIGRYETAPATLLVDRIERVIAQTGQTGFHFVDEAAPPLALRDLALELLRRNVSITWWTNIRFEKTFGDDLCRLLAASGCIAVSGGLEVASDRLLKRMEKGVTVEQVARVAHAFTRAGIMVHAYLMYGFPTQTAQETIDSLEVVRQLFENGVIQSGYWHRFAMTAHSPVGRNPAKYGVVATGPEKGTFAWNDLQHDDPTGCDHERYGPGLAKALYNYMHGVLLEAPLPTWFEEPRGTSDARFAVPRTTHPKNLVVRFLTAPGKPDAGRPNGRVVWLGNAPELEFADGRKGRMATLRFCEKTEDIEVKVPPALGQWLFDVFPRWLPEAEEGLLLKELEAAFPAGAGVTFADFLQGGAWKRLREKGLVLV